MTEKKNPFLSNFICMAKLRLKKESIDPSTNFQLNPCKNTKMVKSWTLTPKTKNDVITAD